MVNDSYDYGWVRLPLPNYQITKNPKAANLQTGDFVKPHYREKTAINEHPLGRIVGISENTALVRWQDEYHPVQVPVDHLIRVEG